LNDIKDPNLEVKTDPEVYDKLIQKEKEKEKEK